MKIKLYAAVAVLVLTPAPAAATGTIAEATEVASGAPGPPHEVTVLRQLGAADRGLDTPTRAYG